jgi:hypothetical protein
MEGIGDRYLCGLSKIPDVPSRVPSADDEQSLARHVKLPLQFRPLFGLGGRIGVEVYGHPLGIQAVEKQDSRAENLRIGRLACPVQPEIDQDRRDPRADQTAD